MGRFTGFVIVVLLVAVALYFLMGREKPQEHVSESRAVSPADAARTTKRAPANEASRPVSIREEPAEDRSTIHFENDEEQVKGFFREIMGEGELALEGSGLCPDDTTVQIVAKIFFVRGSDGVERYSLSARSEVAYYGGDRFVGSKDGDFQQLFFFDQLVDLPDRSAYISVDFLDRGHMIPTRWRNLRARIPLERSGGRSELTGWSFQEKRRETVCDIYWSNLKDGSGPLPPWVIEEK